MEEKQICCCGSSGWTRVIGWFQIVGSVIAVIVLAIALVGSVAIRANADQIKNSDGTPLTPEQMDSLKTVLSAAIVFTLIMLVLTVLSFVMAIVLIRGSYTRNTRFIHYWIVYTVICLVIWTINTIAKIFIQPTGDVIASTIVSLIFGFAIQGFCLWVVGTHKKEIEASGGPVFPVKG